MKLELEVIYFEKGAYSGRKFVEVEQGKSMAMFRATVSKMEKEGKETLICLRGIATDGMITLLNSHRTHIHDPKGSNPGKGKAR